MKKNNKTSLFKTALVMSGFSILLSLGVFVYMTLAVKALVDDDARTFTIRQYQYLKLKFCYDHDIKPCTSKGLDAWNKNHSEDRFELNLSAYSQTTSH
jgi:hypothetical protein